MLKLDSNIYDKCNKAVVITGGARNGTTILGKIVHSFENIEYSFEPPTLYSVFALMDQIDQNSWKLLYETYLYEEFFMNALAGRNLNCNLADDSSIFKVWPESKIKTRQKESLGKYAAEKNTKHKTIVYKIPDIVPFIPKLIEYYPNTRIITITRSAPEVINSLIQKSWFTDKTLTEENLNWPNSFSNSLRIPFWVEVKDHEAWCLMNELHRCAYYYIRMTEAIRKIDNQITIKYSDLVVDTFGVVKKLAQELDCEWGEKTKSIIDSVQLTNKKRD